MVNLYVKHSTIPKLSCFVKVGLTSESKKQKSYRPSQISNLTYFSSLLKPTYGQQKIGNNKYKTIRKY